MRIFENRTLLPVAALVFATVVSGCGGGSRLKVSAPIEKCLARWNQSSNKSGQLSVTILSNDLAGTPAGLVQQNLHGRCKVVLGALDSTYAFGIFFYRPAKKAYVEDSTLEGANRTGKLPPWNVTLNEDGTLALGHP